MKTITAVTSVLALVLIVGINRSTAHPLLRPSLEFEQPSTTPCSKDSHFDSSRNEGHSRAKETGGRGRWDDVPGPYTISIDGEEGSVEKLKGELHTIEPGNFRRGEGRDNVIVATMTATPEISYGAGIAEDMQRHGGLHVSATPAVGNEVTNQGRERVGKRLDEIPNVVATAKPWYKPSPDVSVMSAQESSMVLDKSINEDWNDAHKPSILPVPSALPIAAISPIPVSGADAAESILEGLVSKSPESSEEMQSHETPTAEYGKTGAPVSPISHTHSPSPSAQPSEMPKGACFPGDATVVIQDGSVKRMDELRLGDIVDVGRGEFSAVFMFTHKLDRVVARFARLRTLSGHKLDLSPTHYIYLNGRLAAAGTARVGDSVVLGNGTATAVVKVEQVYGNGLFNPQTVDGNIVVNGITSSTYTLAVEPQVAHALLAPLRFMYEYFTLYTRAGERAGFGYEYLLQGRAIIT